MTDAAYCASCGGTGLADAGRICTHCKGYGRDSGKFPTAEMEAARLWATHQSKAGRWRHGLERLLVRSVRIGAGGFVLLFAFEPNESRRSLVHKPLGALTLDDLASLIGGAVTFFALLALGFWLAFGKHRPPSSPADFMGQAHGVVAARRKERDAQTTLAGQYARSRLWGLIHDPNLGMANRPLLALAIKVGLIVLVYAVLFGWLALTV